MPDNNYRSLHFSNILPHLVKTRSFKEQSEDRIKLTMFLDLEKVPLSN